MKAPGMQVDPAGSTRVLMDLNKVEGVPRDPEGYRGVHNGIRCPDKL